MSEGSAWQVLLRVRQLEEHARVVSSQSGHDWRIKHVQPSIWTDKFTYLSWQEREYKQEVRQVLFIIIFFLHCMWSDILHLHSQPVAYWTDAEAVALLACHSCLSCFVQLWNVKLTKRTNSHYNCITERIVTGGQEFHLLGTSNSAVIRFLRHEAGTRCELVMSKIWLFSHQHWFTFSFSQIKEVREL